jgi:hypothetical protein
MKKHKLYLIFLGSLIGLAFQSHHTSFCQQNPANSIDISINLGKKSFATSEPIWLDVSVKNISYYDIKILPLDLSCMECLKIFLVNSKGDTLSYHGIVSDVTRPPTGYLTEPGNYRSNYFNLLDGFGEMIDGLGIRRFIKPDNYSIIAIYNNIIESNVETLEVKEPEGEEKKALALLMKGYDYHIQLEIPQFDKQLEELVVKYPKSVYADLAYYEMTYWSEDYKDAEEYGKQLVIQYPDSKFTRFAFWKMLRGKTPTQQIQFLKNILKVITVNTRAYDWAQSSLESLQKKEKPEK